MCTGNICRSPLAAALLQARLTENGVEPGAVDVTSAGISFAGHPATADMIKVAETHGVDLSEHESRLLDAPLIDAADLVVGMERMHCREVLALDRDALARTFTLKDLVRRARATEARGADESLGEWLGRVGAAREPAQLLGWSDDDDVADPIGRSSRTYARCGTELADLVNTLADYGWPFWAQGAA